MAKINCVTAFVYCCDKSVIFLWFAEYTKQENYGYNTVNRMYYIKIRNISDVVIDVCEYYVY